jgi:uncharacterized protein (TIGR03083 family)
MNHDAAALIGRDWAEFLALLDGVDWVTPTRLEGWSVEDLARHVHWGMTLEADALELAAGHHETGDGPMGDGATGDGATGDGATGGGATGGGATGGGAVGGRRAAGQELVGPPAQIVPAVRCARARLLRALAAMTTKAAAVLPMPYGDVPLELALQICVMEAAVHRSDLAHALGRDDRLTSGTHAPAAAVLQAFWPALAADAAVTPPPGTSFLLRGSSVAVEAEYDGTAWGTPSGPHAVVISGDDDAVLLAAYGRGPVEAAGITIDGDLTLAHRLKEFVPGP